jgi:hypothetical protein
MRTMASSVYPGANRLVQAFMGGERTSQSAQDAELKNLLSMGALQASMAGKSASAEKAAADAAETRQRTTYTGDAGLPEFVSDQAGGVPLPLVQRFLNFRKTGNWGERPQAMDPQETAQMADQGTPAPAPLPITDVPAEVQPLLQKFAQALQTRGATLGSTSSNPEQIAHAGARYRDQGIEDRALAGEVDPAILGRVRAAMEGKGAFKDNQGRVLDEFTGGLNETGGQARANVAYDTAHAGQAAAAADLHRAQARELNGNNGQGKPPPGYAWGPLNEQGQPTLIAIQGGPANPTGNVASTGNLSGQDLLATLPKPLADQVKALAEGRMQFPAGFALKSPYWQDMISKVSQYDPNFDAVNYNARSRARADATTGTLAKNNNALNTGIGHLAQLSDAVEGLGNVGSMPFARTINKVKNVASKEYGGTGVTDFESIVNRVAPEITKIWRGAGGAEADIKRDIDSLSNANTPEQLHSAIRNIAGLMESKLEANANQYKQGMGTTQQNVEFIIPQAKAQLDLLARRAGKGGAPAERPVGPRAAGALVNAKGWKLMKDAKGNQAYVSPDGAQVEELQ